MAPKPLSATAARPVSRTALSLRVIGGIMAAVLAMLYRDELWAVLTGAGFTTTRGHILPAQPIPHIKWEPDEPFAAKFTPPRMPLVLENAVPTTWPALGKWTPEYLAENVEVLKDAYQHTQRIFTFYDPDKPLAKTKNIATDLRASHKMLDLSAKEFFSHAASAARGEAQSSFFYYSGPLEDFSEELQSDIGPHLDWLSPKEGINNSTSVWMGYNGTTAHTHYDIFWNFNVQLYGTKKYTLFAPSQWAKLYQYPRLHPSYRQSQVNFEDVDVNKYPLFHDVESFEIVVKPGDMLFIPPYWSHRVTALDMSISVNVFSDTSELLLFYDIQKIPLDFLKPFTKSAEEAIYAVRSFLKQVAENTMPTDKVAKFWDSVFETRYKPLRDQLADAVTVDFKSYCASARPKPAVQSAVKGPAKRIGSMFKQMPKDIDVISLANYVEEISRALFGPENVYGFLEHCLATPKTAK